VAAVEVEEDLVVRVYLADVDLIEARPDILPDESGLFKEFPSAIHHNTFTANPTPERIRAPGGGKTRRRNPAVPGLDEPRLVVRTAPG
jgi:hypothetical protein